MITTSDSPTKTEETSSVDFAVAVSPESLRIPETRYDLRILRALRRIMRAVDIYSNKLAHSHGVTVPQLVCMLKIRELGPLTLRELAQEVYLSPSTVVGIVDRLERSRLFTRSRSERDRRKVRIELTEEGQRMVASTPSPLQDSLSASLAELPEEERATVACSLERVLELMSVSHIPEVAPILDGTDSLKCGVELKSQSLNEDAAVLEDNLRDEV